MVMSRTNCCVVDCANTYKNCPPGTKFFSFSSRPCLQHQRECWVHSVQRVNADGTEWRPAKWSRICSVHFVGGKPSTDPSSPSYAPTIFPPAYRKLPKIVEDVKFRNQRWRKRTHDTAFSMEGTASGSLSCEADEEEHKPEALSPPPLDDTDISGKLEISTQTDGHSCSVPASCIVLSCHFYSNSSEASVQCSQIFAPQKKTRERGTGTINVDHLHPRGFNGYESVSSEDEHGEVLKDLTGVTVVSFAVLLRMLTQAKTAGAMEITLGSQLVLFLMKMKHGLTFAALGALFSVHRTIASRTFYAILDTLHSKTRKWLSWLPKDAVQEAIPLSFREKYPTCRVIIDCTEVSIEKPPIFTFTFTAWSGEHERKWQREQISR